MPNAQDKFGLKQNRARINFGENRSNWSRRTFLSRMGKTAGLSLLLGSVPFSIKAQEPFRIGFIPIYPMIQFFVAQQQGWYEEAGILINEARFSSGPPIVQAFAAGEVDVAYIGISPAIVAIARGIRAKVIAANVREPNVILGSNEFRPLWEEFGAQAFEQFKQRKGRRPRFVTLPIGSVPDLLLRFWIIESLGLDLDDAVEIVPVGAPQVLQALAAGDVEGSSIIEPTPTLVDEVGLPFSPIAFAPDILPGQAGAVVEVTERLIDEKPAIVEKLVDIHLRATAFVRENPDATAQFASRVIGTEVLPVATARAALNSPASCFISNPHTIEDGALAYNDFQNRLEIVDRPLTAEEIFDYSFYDKLVAQKPELAISSC